MKANKTGMPTCFGQQIMVTMLCTVLLLACSHQDSKTDAAAEQADKKIVLSDVEGAAMDMVVRQHLTLDGPARDMAVTADGKLLLILLQEKLVVYSQARQKIVDSLPISGLFDRMEIDADNRLFLSSSTRPDLAILKIEPIHDIDIAGRYFMGPEDAPVVIAVFDDYQCPYCSRLEALFDQVLKKYPDSVKLVLKHFPLQRIHKYALKAAQAALAAGKQGKFWDFHHMLFKKQQSLSDAMINEIAGSLNLDMQRFWVDFASAEIRNLIQEDLRHGYDIGVRGTPTIYINGKLLPSEKRSLDGISAIIDAELDKSTQAKTAS
jgi:predicted DsbA family dithiol-disulfide isomerase